LDVLETRYLKIAGVGESHLADYWLHDLSQHLKNGLDIAFLPSTGQVSLRITARAHDRQQAVQDVESLAKMIRNRLGELVYTEEKEESLASALGRILETEKYTIATAESCTGGLMGHLLTETPGSSAYVKGGIISYDNQVKVHQLGVMPSDLETHGAVSAPVALAMAKGVAQRLGAEVGISATGIAGPDGGSVEKPVGTVWLGFFTPSEHFAVRAEFSHNRSLNKLRSAITAFEIARRNLLGMENLPYDLKKITPESMVD
jgi:nicotinamide-nucleotide amidase